MATVYMATYEGAAACAALGGPLTLTSDGEALTGLYLTDQKYFLAGVSGLREERPDLPVFAQARAWLDRYFAAGAPAREAQAGSAHGSANPWPTPADLPLAPVGSAFRQRVWRILSEIPRGELRTYGDIARQFEHETGRPVANQAVGGAVGHNPISIIIPCHRVVGTNGSLTGYAGGVRHKVWLLEHEGVDLAARGLFVPTRGTAL